MDILGINSHMGAQSSFDACYYQQIDPFDDLRIGYAGNFHDINISPSFPMDYSDQFNGFTGMEKIQAIRLLGSDPMRETTSSASYQELLITDKICWSLPLEPPLTTYQKPKDQLIRFNGENMSLYKEFVNMNRRCMSIKRRQVKQPNVIKGQWTLEEDRLLEKLVRNYGLGKWAKIAGRLKGRVGKQCRERWHNHLKPNIKKENWSEEEDKILIQAHMQIGNRWAEIARRIPGRTENSIKNHWNATKRRQFSRRRCKNTQPVTLLQTYIKSLYSGDDREVISTDVTTHDLSTSDVKAVPEFYDLEDIARFLMDDGGGQGSLAAEEMGWDVNVTSNGVDHQVGTTGFEKKDQQGEIDLVEMMIQMNVNICNSVEE